MASATAVLKMRSRMMLRWTCSALARVIGGELRIVEQRHLLRDALDRRDAVDERAAGARRLRGVEHRGAALAGEAPGVPRRVRKRADERQDHEREAGEQQREEGSRVKNHNVSFPRHWTVANVTCSQP